MATELVHVGFGNVIAMNRVVAIVSPDSAPIKRILRRLREEGNHLIDMTEGRKTKAVIFLDSGHIALAPIEPRSIAGRLVSSPGIVREELTPSPEEA